MALTLAAINVTATFAQDDEKTTMYNAFVACYKETDTAKRDTCYAGAKQYLDKYEKSADGTVDQYGAFVRKKYDAYVKAKSDEATFGKFDIAIKDPKNVNADNAFSSGKEIIAGNPDLIDVPIVLASIGFDNAALATPNDKYNADAINYAKMSIDKINAGKTSKQYGAYQWTYQTAKYPDGKSNTLGWMNYTIGYIMYYRQNQKKEALPYLYKATQLNSETKNNFRIYAAIGKWYVDEFKRLDDERVAKIKAAGDQDTDETKAIFAMQKGYADRAAEAYSRAYKLALNDTTATKENRDGLMTVAKQFYGIRYNNDATKFDGYDTYATGLTSKTFTDPTTDVTPVAEPVPATTTTTSGTAATTTTAAPSTTTTKPAATTTTTTTKPATTTTTTTTTKKPTATTVKPSTKTSAKSGTR